MLVMAKKIFVATVHDHRLFSQVVLNLKRCVQSTKINAPRTSLSAYKPPPPPFFIHCFCFFTLIKKERKNTTWILLSSSRVKQHSEAVPGRPVMGAQKAEPVPHASPVSRCAASGLPGHDGGCQQVLAARSTHPAEPLRRLRCAQCSRSERLFQGLWSRGWCRGPARGQSAGQFHTGEAGC